MTSAMLCDYRIGTLDTTLHTPFKQLGITPEGCSSRTFSAEARKVMLDEGRQVDARTGLELDLLDELVEVTTREGGAESGGQLHAEGGSGDVGRAKGNTVVRIEDRNVALVNRAREVALEWLRTGRQRPMIEQGIVEALRKQNRVESAALGHAIISKPFVRNLMKTAEKKGQTGPAWLFWAAGITQPLWSKL